MNPGKSISSRIPWKSWNGYIAVPETPGIGTDLNLERSPGIRTAGRIICPLFKPGWERRSQAANELPGEAPRQPISEIRRCVICSSCLRASGIPAFDVMFPPRRQE